VKKVQVTLADEQYQNLAYVAERDGKKLAAVVRESVEKYCLEPEMERRKRKALEDLLQTPPAPAPEKYSQWKREYGALKGKSKKEKDRS